jgi:hypothetical protein
MKLKIILFLAIAAIVGSSITVLVIQAHHPHSESVPPGSQLPTALSNYSKTFKLNTSPPLWRDSQSKGVTNGNVTN